MYVIAHISDTHFDGGDHAADRAARVMAYLAKLAEPVDVVLVTGDIADHGLPEEYDEARKALGSPYPMMVCPGNHDVRGPFRRTLLCEVVDVDPETPINMVRSIGGVTFAMCDSSIPGEDSGHLSDETLTWLDDVLAATEEPAFVCFHHPPVPLHVPHLDLIRLHGEKALTAVLARHPHVVAVLVGHAHSAAASTFAGRPLLIAPGVVSTVVLPWEHDGFIDTEQPPGVAFHVLDDDGRLTTHYRVVL